MLCCISIGIRDYSPQTKLSSIPCAAKDAQRVYRSFRTIMGEEFNDYASICASDINQRNFEELLCTVADTIREEEDTKIVVYFSGHATIRNDRFCLLFRDYDGRTTGSYEIDRFKSAFGTFRNKVLLILDCCQAGDALAVATNKEQNSEISVLAACSAYSTAKFDDTGSLFTKALCDSIEDVHGNEASFTLEVLLKYMKMHNYDDSIANVGASNDLSFKFRDMPSTQVGFSDFSDVFLQKLSKNSLLVREAMWYSLDGMPNSFILAICKKYFDHSRPVEASWLVRRAIGSTLANHAEMPAIEALLMELLDSDYWQEQCIALIGLRYLIATKDTVLSCVLERIKTRKISRVDAVWLANLYAADNPHYDSDCFKHTVLTKTAWGTMEILKTQLTHNPHFDVTMWKESPFYDTIEREYLLLRTPEAEKSELTQKIYIAAPRGRFPQNTKAKFLLSALYGNWRNQITPDLKSYLETRREDEIGPLLVETRSIPSVERRMALFAYFKENLNFGERFAEHLTWGLEDLHPWVRRSAVEFYQCFPQYEDALHDCYIKMRQDADYPGILDFYLTCPQKWRDELLGSIRKQGLLITGDRNSLEVAFKYDNV